MIVLYIAGEIFSSLYWNEAVRVYHENRTKSEETKSTREILKTKEAAGIYHQGLRHVGPDIL